MKILKATILTLFVILNQLAFAANKMTREEYIAKFAELAVKEMQRVGVPASITLAQGCLESEDGNSMLAVKAHNHFGIKCHKSWTGKTIYKDDDKRHECFRVYSTDYQSYIDHSDFLKNGERYAFLFELKTTDYKGWAHGLKKAGYATNPKYPQLLIKIIEENKLYEYDNSKNLDRLNKRESQSEQLADNSSDKHKIWHHDKKSKDKKPSTTTIDDSESNQPPIKVLWSEETISLPEDILENNHINYIIVHKGDTYYSIAKKYDLMEWQIYSFNDLEKDHVLKAGEIIYLQMKKNRPEKKYSSHTAKPGESLHTISQIYGVRLKKLQMLNRVEPYESLKGGEKILLVVPK